MTSLPETPEAVRAVADVSRETLERLEIYAELLRRWQRTTQLVAPSTLPRLWSRHMADSAQLLALAPKRACVDCDTKRIAGVPPAQPRLDSLHAPTSSASAPRRLVGARRWADLGSGGGFPGLVLAICLTGQEGALVHLIESNARKCAFLRAVIRETWASAQVHDARIETALPPLAPELDAVTARALAPLGQLLGLAAPALAAGATGLFPKGEDARRELTAAEQIWNMRAELRPSLTDPKASIVVVEELRRRGRDEPSEMRRS